MDEYLHTIARYSLHPFNFPPEIINEAKKRVIDTFGVAIAATNEIGAIVKNVPQFQVHKGSTTLGLWKVVPPDHAAFINGFLARYLDFNDTYLSREPQHPSDVIMPLLALSEFNGNSGREFLEAVAIAYEIDTTLCDWASLKEHGWDHVNYIGISVAAAGARLLGLELEQTKNAISMTIVSNIALRQTRIGKISMWKGAAAANSAKNAIFSTLLAKAGISAPDAPFSGAHGLINQLLSNEKLEDAAFQRLKSFEEPEKILDTHVKIYPVEYMAQGAIDAILSLNIDYSEIREIVVETFEMAYSILARDPERWNPETRETADHSLPYLVARAIFDKKIDLQTFSKEKITDPAVREFIREKIRILVKESYTKMYPEALPTKVIIKLQDGRILEKEVLYPRGHARNPLDYNEIVEKFINLAGEHPDFLDAVRNLERSKSVNLLFEKLNKKSWRFL